MRRLITGLLALALLALTAAGIRNADALALRCRSVSMRYRTSLDGETVANAEKKQPGLTFWCEETVDLAADWRQTQAAALLYRGDAFLVLGQDCAAGSLPAPLDKFGCAVSSALAWELFGSEDAVGLTLSLEGMAYTVRGVFESDGLLALLPMEDAAFTAVELPTEEKTGQDPAAWTDARLARSGLPAPDWRLYTGLPGGLARFLSVLPLLFGAGALAAALVRRAARLAFPARDAIFFALLGAAALALPALFAVWPSWLTPSRWSDFSWWGQTADQLGEMWQAFLLAPGAGRDLALKAGLLVQAGLALAQCVLCEALRCRFRAARAESE